MATTDWATDVLPHSFQLRGKDPKITYGLRAIYGVIGVKVTFSVRYNGAEIYTSQRDWPDFHIDIPEAIHRAKLCFAPIMLDINGEGIERWMRRQQLIGTRRPSTIR